jgi:hypothetical protein
MAIGKFGNKAATPAAGAKRPAPKPVQRVSKYGAAKDVEDRDPMPVVGTYRFRVLGCEDNPSPKNPSNMWFRTQLEIIALEGPQAEQTHQVGDVVVMIQQTAGNGAPQGIPRVVAFVRHAAGYEDFDEYKAYDPDGYFIDAQSGIVNDYSERGEFIVGRLVDAQVTRGRDREDGDYYREYKWAVVPDDEQDQLGKVGAL